jgi:hypothetical protein
VFVRNRGREVSGWLDKDGGAVTQDGDTAGEPVSHPGGVDDCPARPTAVLFDVLADVEGQLRARYLSRSRDPRRSESERDDWRRRAFALWDEFQAVAHDDRARLLELTDRWARELTASQPHR